MLVDEKSALSTKKRRVPLSARPMDLLYFVFFASHLIASLSIDLQSLYPPSLVPSILRKLLHTYVQFSNDPLIGGLAGLKDSSSLLWFKTFIVLEGLFQIPVFILGLWGLYQGSKKIYPLLLIYAAQCSTSTLPCVIYVLSLPEPTPATKIMEHAATFDQRLIMLSGYVPFFLIPLIMVFDLGRRTYKLICRVKEDKLERWTDFAEQYPRLVAIIASGSNIHDGVKRPLFRLSARQTLQGIKQFYEGSNGGKAQNSAESS